MGEYVVSIELGEDGRWTSTADGLIGEGAGFTAARDALKDAFYERDGQEPRLRRDRTEVPIPSAAERNPERLMAFLAAEATGYKGGNGTDLVARQRELLAVARHEDAEAGEDGDESDRWRVVAWCVQTAGLVVLGRAREPEESSPQEEKADPRSAGDPFLARWRPYELDRLTDMVPPVPRTVDGIMAALDDFSRPRAWKELLGAEYGPQLERAMIHWWHTAMQGHPGPLRKAVERIEGGERGIAMTDLASSRALDDLRRDLTERERDAEQRQFRWEDENGAVRRQAEEDGYVADLERRLREVRDRREYVDQDQVWQTAVGRMCASVTPHAYRMPVDPAFLDALDKGRRAVLPLPAKPWRRSIGAEPHFVLTVEGHGDERMLLARTNATRQYATLVALRAAESNECALPAQREPGWGEEPVIAFELIAVER
ncbi:hypothetical protein [Streptomyces sp. NBC_01465]|uniref:hypothetical protein n=1 Tax=Streptomyces sp. NBC_01465 TaxID=2903878 RepID=UPI002E31E6C8|nr:hypothetical protein [Streptomyces sp. NBC_01465]